MSIPLDRLYSFIDQTAREIYGETVVIYRFWPHGSKNLQDLNLLNADSYGTPPCYMQLITKLIVWCYDQDPLLYDFYKDNPRQRKKNVWNNLLESLGLLCQGSINWSKNIFQKNILLHSEKRSGILKKFQDDNELLPVYYWSHAMIARDWFRYAEYQDFKKNVNKKLFLIYNRAWTGTRKYRLKLSDLLIEHNLVNHCLTWFNPVDSDQHYKDHVFLNASWSPKHVLENYFEPSTADPSYSADFISQDYQSTEIEVVLETLFDDDRLHLTEKTLRPIACGQPFILAATHGSLQYLREYGFQTYDSVWDETYDTIQDPYQRMQAIIRLMLEISARSPNQRYNDARRMQQIADYNHKHFFSKDFADIVLGELRTNMNKAFDQIKQDPGFENWQDRWKCLLKFPQVQDFLDVNQNSALPTRPQYEQVLEFIKQYPKTIADVNKI